LCHWNFLLT